MSGDARGAEPSDFAVSGRCYPENPWARPQVPQWEDGERWEKIAGNLTQCAVFKVKNESYDPKKLLPCRVVCEATVAQDRRSAQSPQHARP